jgi:hypothetical protein
VVELRAKGWSLRAIGAHLGVDHKTVHRDLVSMGQVAGGNAPSNGANAPGQMPHNNVIELRRLTTADILDRLTPSVAA